MAIEIGIDTDIKVDVCSESNYLSSPIGGLQRELHFVMLLVGTAKSGNQYRYRIRVCTAGHQLSSACGGLQRELHFVIVCVHCISVYYTYYIIYVPCGRLGAFSLLMNEPCQGISRSAER